MDVTEIPRHVSKILYLTKVSIPNHFQIESEFCVRYKITVVERQSFVYYRTNT